MLSKKNYLSKIVFDLESYTDIKGSIENYTTTWQKADKKLKSQFFNNQTSKKNYFRKRIPENILTIENPLERAKEIYTFIQQYFTWSKNYWTNKDAKIKNAFDEAIGGVGEINLSIYNSLKAANLNAKLVVLSTKDNGIPTKLYPIILPIIT